MTREEAAKVLEKQFDESCGDYRYQNKDKLDYEDALWLAIAALRELDAQEKPESFGEWISVKDRLPEPNVIVLCCTNKGYVDTDSFGRYSKVFLKCDDMEGKVGQVIAWMPMPEPPKEEHYE